MICAEAIYNIFIINSTKIV